MGPSEQPLTTRERLGGVAFQLVVGLPLVGMGGVITVMLPRSIGTRLLDAIAHADAKILPITEELLGEFGVSVVELAFLPCAVALGVLMITAGVMMLTGRGHLGRSGWLFVGSVAALATATLFLGSVVLGTWSGGMQLVILAGYTYFCFHNAAQERR